MKLSTVIKAAIPVLIGAAGGAVATYGIVRDRYMLLTVDELEHILYENGQEAILEHMRGELAEDDEEAIGSLSYLPDPNEHAEEVEEYEQIVNIFDYAESEKPANPSVDEMPRTYAIGIDEYTEENGYLKKEVKYCKGFNMVLDENDEPIENPDLVLGATMMSWLSTVSEDDMDNRYIHVRNDNTSEDYEVEILDVEESREIAMNLA